MAKFTCVNLPGHYEGNGIEVNVFPQQITVTTRDYQKQPKQRQEHRESEPRNTDDGNMSIISSLQTIAGKFNKKK